ncbi:hypothetical protein LCGC14_1991440 [marine sediment metagenome]|uniref:Uncharacterized protein n=1 Tax=marine sediment metagenome TaxID=412755 RepID=A0A0F9I343_9ZZZZ
MPDPRIFPIESANDAFATVGVVSAIALAANPARADTDFVNDSDTIIYLARGNAAVIGSGIRLNPNGGSYHIGLYNLFLGDVYAIATGANSNMTISEGTKP